jgi:uncharacterized coiled-coil protein SlyX
MSELRQQLAEIQAEVLALPHDKAVAAVFANLFIYAQAIESLLSQVGRLQTTVTRLQDQLEKLTTMKERQASEDLTALLAMTDDLKPLAGLVRDLRSGYEYES